MTQTISLDWQMVDRAAEALGVKIEARKKWRQRGIVPHKWRLPIIQKTGGVISADAFEKKSIPGRGAQS